jgi:hypothetical protein
MWRLLGRLIELLQVVQNDSNSEGIEIHDALLKAILLVAL